MPDVLIADDHPLFRDALQHAVLQALPQVAAHCAQDVNSLQCLVEQYPYAELLLLDLHMPGARGFSVLAHLRGHHPSLPVIVVSGHEEAAIARRALAHGASGYIPKSTPSSDIIQAIHQVLDGDTWLPAHLAAAAHTPLPSAEADTAERIASLTPHQFRVLTLIAEGLLNKQIAFDLGISEATVKAHMTAIMRKLGVNNRTQVALAANQLAIEKDALPRIPDEN